jgi:predicted transcriptional regulator
MLKAIGESAKKTQIMYRSNLSYKLLSKYLNDIIDAGLIIFEPDRQCYTPTSKGKEFLERYKEYLRRNRHVERQLSEVQLKRRVLEDLCVNKDLGGNPPSPSKSKDNALIF